MKMGHHFKLKYKVGRPKHHGHHGHHAHHDHHAHHWKHHGLKFNDDSLMCRKKDAKRHGHKHHEGKMRLLLQRGGLDCIQRPNIDFVAAETVIFGRNVVDPPRQEETTGNNCGCSCHQTQMTQVAQPSTSDSPPQNEEASTAQFLAYLYRSAEYRGKFHPIKGHKLKLRYKK